MDPGPDPQQRERRGRRAAAVTVFWLLATATDAIAQMPWREAGLSERQAAAHLLARFTYGPRPGDVERVVAMGLENWLDWQLQGDAAGAAASAVLARLASVSLTGDELVKSYPHHTMVVAQAITSGVISRADYTGQLGEERRRLARRELERFATALGYRPPKEVLAELRARKLFLAVYSQSQLTEVLTDFWFNHFNVSAGSNDCRPYVVSYEREIRSRVLGGFRDLLGATAKHPAMMVYLDNAYSQAEPGALTTFRIEMETFGSFSPSENPTLRQELAKAVRWRPPGMSESEVERHQGLNENYARELLELHTLGVDGGYGQDDVIEVARAFTGWGLPPRSEHQRQIFLAAAEGTDLGFVADGEFLFRADRHDADPKTVLGVPLPGGRGIEDGEEVLDLLVRHPATARHLVGKIAVRFVSDQPSEELIGHLARAWEISGADLREVVRALVTSREFWLEGRAHSKLKSPFEMVASAIRVLDAEIVDPAMLIRWIGHLGQPLYTCSPPTGYPDRPETWASAGTLLARVNFAETLARGRIRGVTYDLLGLVGDRLVASPTEALRAFLPLALPERRLGELLTAATTAAIPKESDAAEAGGRDGAAPGGELPEAERLRRAERYGWYALALLLASPEFQQR